VTSQLRFSIPPI